MLPAGLNANWSLSKLCGKDGRRYFLTMIRSVTLDNIDVTEIGRSSDNGLGFVTFGTGVTSACLQWLGLPEVTVSFIKWVMT